MTDLESTFASNFFLKLAQVCQVVQIQPCDHCKRWFGTPRSPPDCQTNSWAKKNAPYKREHKRLEKLAQLGRFDTQNVTRGSFRCLHSWVFSHAAMPTPLSHGETRDVCVRLSMVVSCIPYHNMLITTESTRKRLGSETEPIKPRFFPGKKRKKLCVAQREMMENSLCYSKGGLYTRHDTLCESKTLFRRW